MRGIRLRGEDVVVAMIVAAPETFLLTACETGNGKRTPIDDYPVKGRGGLGVINIRTEGRNGRVVGMLLCRENDEVMFITQSGMIVRSPVADMRPMGRNTQGVRLVNLKEDDKLVAIELVSAEDLEQYAATARVRPVPPIDMSPADGPDEVDDVDAQLDDDEPELDDDSPPESGDDENA